MSAAATRNVYTCKFLNRGSD